MRRFFPLLLPAMLGGAAPPEEFLAVPEWWGSVVITHEADAEESGVRDGLAWRQSRKVQARFAFDFQMSKTHAGGFVPSKTPPSMEEMAEAPKSRRTWYAVPAKGSLKMPASLLLDDRSEEEGDTPVEGKVVDRQGTSHAQSVRAQVEMMLVLPQLIVDAKKGVYHLILGNLPMNLGSVPAPDRFVQWIRSWRGEYHEDVQTSKRGATGLYPTLSELKVDPTQHLNQALPGSAARIEGSTVYDVRLPGFKTAKGRIMIRWLLSPKPPEPVELLIEKSAGYDEWRPKAGLDEEVAGAHLPVTIILQKKGGGEPGDLAKSMTCRLLNVSREPGTCLNWPQDPKTPAAPDLRFEAGLNTGRKDEATVERTDGGLKRIVVVVSSYDWGAFGELQASAVLQSGREIFAEVKGDPGRSTLRIPKSMEGSRIADSWRSKFELGNAPDDADKDEEPQGDGTPGDGLSLYEEYRGFVQAGYRVAPSPRTKNFFIYDKIGGDSKEGIRLFKDATKLDVHHKLRETETGKKNVVNVNTSGYGHRVNQHLVTLDSHVETGFSAAVGGPGPPKEIQHVLMAPHPSVQRPDLTDDLREQAAGYWCRTLAHELLHCCNVYHHGDRDVDETWERAQDKDGAWKFWKASVAQNGTVTRLGAPLRLFIEPNTPAVLSPSPTVMKVSVGEKQGQHSGFEVCLMRYDTADVYRKGPNEYFWIRGEEPTGETLCRQREGADYNKIPRVTGANFPMSRHGQADTSVDRGRCLFQLRVTDEGAPKRRGK